VLLLLALFLMGCPSAQVRRFTAEPNVVCRGTQVRLSWDANADGVLSSAPADPTLGEVPKLGERLVTPPATTLYRLEVHYWFSKIARDNTVEVRAAPDGPKPLVGSVADATATCDGRTLALTIDANEKYWDSLLSVGDVARIGDRPLTVEHGGKTAELLNQDASSAFAGTTAQGRWRLSTPLSANETSASPSLPNSLAINVFTRCQPSTRGNP
jgi:hypothetical protein